MILRCTRGDHNAILSTAVNVTAATLEVYYVAAVYRRKLAYAFKLFYASRNTPSANKLGPAEKAFPYFRVIGFTEYLQHGVVVFISVQ